MKNTPTTWRLTTAIVLAWISLFASIIAYSQEGGTSVTVTGRLDVQIIENFDQETAAMAYFLQADTGSVYELQFSNSPPADLKTGQSVTVQGIAEGNQLRVDAVTFQPPDLAMPIQQNSTIGSDAAMPPAPSTEQHRAVVLLTTWKVSVKEAS